MTLPLPIAVSITPEQWAQTFQSCPDVVLAYQHGSTIKHPDGPHGDLDLALLCRARLDPEQRLALITTVGTVVRAHVPIAIDVRILNDASPIFAFQVLKHGRRVYGDATTARNFVVTTLTRYFDYLPLQQFFIRRLEQRLGVTPHG
ncbi:MAG: nucleotidyltransferase domain-containing protein [Deltaproteobacteria bacterium]|nr:nucleotidyltransferase domain-containing protein [Deltaproteobacteria bacterium]